MTEHKQQEVLKLSDRQDRIAQLQQALDFERMLKRITEKVRDRLDESQILQTAVEELALRLGADCCKTALYNADQTLATIRYEYTNSLVCSQRRVVSMADFPEIYSQLLQGQYCQFCQSVIDSIPSHAVILACPIFDNEGVLGDLWLFHQNGSTFSELEIRLVQQVSYQCARALRQARLYQASQAQVEELEKLNSVKDDFLNTVSHELRTPVANMKMAIQMLEIALNQKSLDCETAKQKAENTAIGRYFRILQDECEREISLINDLLDLQRLDAGAQPLELTEIHLKDWIPYIIEPFEERSRKHQQILQVEISDELPPIFSDWFSLERLVTELLNNACKYTPEGEQITVTAGGYEGMIQLSVSNSGVEIPAGELPRIFDKFYRIPSIDRWRLGGTGLGLSLVKKLTERLGGTIQVKSASSHTCFTVEFPIHINQV